jgi:hypothetical protein
MDSHSSQAGLNTREEEAAVRLRGRDCFHAAGLRIIFPSN